MANELTAEQAFRMQHYAGMAKLVKAFRESFGEEAYAVVVRHNGENALAQWRAIAEKTADHSIEALIRHLWEPLKTEGFTYETEQTEEGVQMKCTRCGFYELAKRGHMTEEAFYMICAADPYITEGFNPNIGFKRTRTLMQGHDCCDHFYYYKDKR